MNKQQKLRVIFCALNLLYLMNQTVLKMFNDFNLFTDSASSIIQ